MDGSVHASSSVHAPLVGIWNLGQNAANLAQVNPNPKPDPAA